MVNIYCSIKVYIFILTYRSITTPYAKYFKYFTTVYSVLGIVGSLRALSPTPATIPRYTHIEIGHHS